MNRSVALKILSTHLDSLLEQGYATLAAQIGTDQYSEVIGNTGIAYQLEITFLWDHQPNGAIRLIGSIDDGGLSAFLPVTISHLVEPPPVRLISPTCSTGDDV